MQAKMGLLGSMAIGTLNQDITPYGELDKMIDNNGIERLGGITNQHLTTGTLPSSASIPTPSGKIMSLVGTGDTRTVQVDGVSVGAVSAYGVAERGEFQGYLDACASQDGLNSSA